MTPLDTLDTNLLSSRGKRASVAEPETPSPPVSRTTKALTLTAYVLIFLISLAFFMFMKIPDSAVTILTLSQLNANTPYSWRADKVGFRIFVLPPLLFEKLELEPKFQAGTGMSITSMKL